MIDILACENNKAFDQPRRIALNSKLFTLKFNSNSRFEVINVRLRNNFTGENLVLSIRFKSRGKKLGRLSLKAIYPETNTIKQTGGGGAEGQKLGKKGIPNIKIRLLKWSVNIFLYQLYKYLYQTHL